MEFGFTMPNRKIVVNDVRIRGTGRTDIEEDPILPSSNEPPKFEKARMSMSNTNIHETLNKRISRSLFPTKLDHHGLFRERLPGDQSVPIALSVARPRDSRTGDHNGQPEHSSDRA